MANGAKSHNARTDGPFPLHRGPFLFAPRFLSESDWFPTFKLLIDRVLENLTINTKVYQTGGARIAIVEFAKAEMIIDGGRGTFSLYERGYQTSEIEDSMDYWGGPEAVPAQFLKELENPESAALLDSDYENICNFSERIFTSMKRRFRLALQEGFAELTGRIGKQLAPLTVLDFRLLRRLQLKPLDRIFEEHDDLELDEAISGDEEPLYDLGIRATGLTVDPASKATPLISEASRRGPGRPPIFDFEAILPEMLALIGEKGFPSSKKRNWTGEMFVTALKKRLGDNSPEKSWIREKLPLAIARYKSDRLNKDFQQSSKS
jgi:hypothetical protein